MTQEELAEASGLHAVAISLLECGKRVPSISTFFGLASALHVRASVMTREIETLAKRPARRKIRRQPS